jgi:hypothetical protein
MKSNPTGAAPERSRLVRSKHPTSNTSAGRLAQLMECRRRIDGVLLSYCRQYGIPPHDLTEAMTSLRRIVQEAFNRPDPRARLKQRREKMRGEMEQAFRRAIVSAEVARLVREPRP